MKILFLTNYFPPDFSAGSFRMNALIECLEYYKKFGLEVTLITTMPSRYGNIKLQAEELEDRGWLKIHRIKVPAHSNTFLGQVRSYITFARGAWRLQKYNDYDLVFATSSRLMTAVLAALVARSKSLPLYLDIRDLFIENIRELFNVLPVKFLIPILTYLEKFTFTYASKINVVSAGFVEAIRLVDNKKVPTVYTNGIDDVFAKNTYISSNQNGRLPLVVYAGNIGDGQGLQNILPAAAKLLENKVEFKVIGEGSRKNELLIELAKKNVTNLEIVSAVSREKLIRYYNDASILFMHLNDLKAFEKVLPSKIFEYAATGKPLLAGVKGHARDFILKEVEGVEVFNPCDAIQMSSLLLRLLDGPKQYDRSGFIQKYTRKTIMQQMARDIVESISAK